MDWVQATAQWLRRLGALTLVATIGLTACGGSDEQTTSATVWVFRDNGSRPPSRVTVPDETSDTTSPFETTTTFGTLPSLPITNYDGEYCAALTTMWQHTFMVFIGRNTDGTWPTFADDVNGLADIVEAAAALAPRSHRAALTTSADTYRRIATIAWVDAQYEPLFTGGANLEYATDEYFNQVCLGQAAG